MPTCTAQNYDVPAQTAADLARVVIDQLDQLAFSVSRLIETCDTNNDHEYEVCRWAETLEAALGRIDTPYDENGNDFSVNRRVARQRPTIDPMRFNAFQQHSLVMALNEVRLGLRK